MFACSHYQIYLKHESSKEHHGSPCNRGRIWSFLVPSLSFTEVSANNITTKEREVKSFLGAFKDMRAQNMKAGTSSG